MTNNNPAENKVKTPAEVMVEVVNLLTPLASEDRKRVVSAALTMLGETSIAPEISQQKASIDIEVMNDGTALLPRAKTWLKQNGLTSSDLEQVFHTSSAGVEYIAPDVPGNNSKEKTYNAYLLAGISKLLLNGEPNFDDKSARDLCRTLGCFNEGNHANYLKDKGNGLTGSKEKGWTLTAPGLKQAAGLVVTLSKA